MIKKFRYQEYPANYNKNYVKLSVNKYNLTYFKNIIYDGFTITKISVMELEFEIDTQLIRKLKICNIDNNFSNKNELKIIQLLDRSIEIIKEDFWSYASGVTYTQVGFWYSSTFSRRKQKNGIDPYEKNEHKHRIRLDNQKIKNYKK